MDAGERRASTCPWPSFSDQGVVLENDVVLTTGPAVSIASDPTVRWNGIEFEMVFTCLNFDLGDPKPTQLCLATSPDGVNWTRTAGPYGGAILRGANGGDQRALEGADMVFEGATRWLFFSTYSGPTQADPVVGFPATLRLASATDIAGPFALNGTVPVPRTVGGPDNDAAYSPSAIRTADGWSMFYAGHCYPRSGVDCPLTWREACPLTGRGNGALLLSTRPALKYPLWSPPQWSPKVAEFGCGMRASIRRGSFASPTRPHRFPEDRA